MMLLGVKPLLDSSQPITIEALQQAKKVICEEIIDDARVVAGPLDKRIDFLQKVDIQTQEVMRACNNKEEELQAEISAMPWWYLEKIEASLGLGIFGGSSRSLASVKAVRIGLLDRFKELGQRNLKILDELNTQRDGQTMTILHLYDLIGQIQPEDKRYLKGMAERLVIEQAYSKAIDFLNTCSEHYPNDVTLLHKKVLCLHGLEKYQEALEVIRDYKVTCRANDETKAAVWQRAQFESARVDCLVGAKEYLEAEKILEQLIRQFPRENYLKGKMISVSVMSEVERHDPKEQQFFLERAKKQFTQLDEYAQLAWTSQSMEADLSFWLFVLCSNPLAVEGEEIFGKIQEEIHKLVDKRVVSVAAIEKEMTRMATILTKEVGEFKDQFQRFLQETSSEDIPSLKGILNAIREARIYSMKIKVYGERNRNSNSGIVNKIKVIKTLLEYFKKDPQFQEGERKTFLHNTTHTVASAENELTLCVQGLQKMCSEGFHPFAQSLVQAITASNNQLLITSS